MSAKRRPRPQATATCGACGERLRAKTLDELNAQLTKHYRKCK